ncbi:MurR/RpiR family transcriptional regulator [Desnuesiella massiliensis]|uniref:MurR/RpiR family transcriptional regulator n=1 Tax=Desnuesiella massiliensis TaxID=1650662 RepID=UPI0006E186CF|nr:MurR/RpiR family transcriptional regulator [Desnuesiella massiliensis]
MKFDLKKIVKNKDITALEQQVLEYIIENIDLVMDMGVRGVAKENFTSTSTIMRLAKKLGYTGFVDMVYNIMPLVKDREEPSSGRVASLQGVDLSYLLKYTSEEEINHCIEILREAKDKIIYIYAAGFSKILAEYLSRKLLTMGLRCILCDSIGLFENNISSMEIFIVISKSGETKEALDKVKVAKDRGIKVISFTREVENSLSELSDINLKVYDMHKLDDRNMYPNTFFPNTCMLMEYLVYKYYDKQE